MVSSSILPTPDILRDLCAPISVSSALILLFLTSYPSKNHCPPIQWMNLASDPC